MSFLSNAIGKYKKGFPIESNDWIVYNQKQVKEVINQMNATPYPTRRRQKGMYWKSGLVELGIKKSTLQE